MSRRAFAIAALAAILGGYAAPAHAQEPQQPKRSAATVVKWTLIGAAAGAGIGFLAGFHAYDDAAYAETRIAKASVAGGAIGAAAGFGFGLWRSQPAAPRIDTSRSVWRIDGRMPSRARVAWTPQEPAPTLRSLSRPVLLR